MNYYIFDIDVDKSESIESIISVCHRLIVEQYAIRKHFLIEGSHFGGVFAQFVSYHIASIRKENQCVDCVILF